MSVDKNVEVVLEAFSAIERRDDQRFLDLLHPDRAPAFVNRHRLGKSVALFRAGTPRHNDESFLRSELFCPWQLNAARRCECRFFLSDGTATSDIGDVSAADLQKATCAAFGAIFAQVLTVDEMLKKISSMQHQKA